MTDYDALLKELREKPVWPIVTAQFFEFLRDQRRRSADAIEALKAERDALKARAEAAEREIADRDERARQAVAALEDFNAAEMARPKEPLSDIVHLDDERYVRGVMFDAEKARAEKAEAENARLRAPLQQFVDFYPQGINPDLDEAERMARDALAPVEAKLVPNPPYVGPGAEAFNNARLRTGGDDGR
jgi:hypothetical protein